MSNYLLKACCAECEDAERMAQVTKLEDDDETLMDVLRAIGDEQFLQYFKATLNRVVGQYSPIQPVTQYG